MVSIHIITYVSISIVIYSWRFSQNQPDSRNLDINQNVKVMILRYSLFFVIFNQFVFCGHFSSVG